MFLTSAVPLTVEDHRRIFLASLLLLVLLVRRLRRCKSRRSKRSLAVRACRRLVGFGGFGYGYLSVIDYPLRVNAESPAYTLIA